MPGNTQAISIPPPGFQPDPNSGQMVNAATGQTANWDAKQGAWVDSATGKAVPRKENISAAPPTGTTPPATDDPCAGARQAAAWARGLQRAYEQELGHSDSVVESEVMNIADLSREIKNHIEKDPELAQLIGETGVKGIVAAAGVSVGASAVAGTPVFAATGEIVGYVATSTLGLAVMLPLAGAIIGTSLGLAVRNIWDAADRKVEFKKALDMLDRARGRMSFFLEHSAALRTAAVDAGARAAVAARAYEDCRDSSKAKKDPCSDYRSDVADQDGYLEGLRRTLEAVRSALSAATDAQARADAAAAGATGNQAAVQKSTASFEAGIVRATTLEQGRLERLMKDAVEELGKRKRALKDCSDKNVATPPATPGKSDQGAGPSKNKLLLGAIVVAVAGTLFGVGVLGLGGKPGASPSATSRASLGATPTSVAGATATPVTVSPVATKPGTPAPTNPVTPPPASVPASNATAACSGAGALLELGGSSDAAAVNQVCSLFQPDETGDWVEANGDPPAVQLPSSDLLGTALFRTPISIAWATRINTLCAQPGSEVACAGTAGPGDHLAFVTELGGDAAPLAGAFWETGVGYGTAGKRWATPLVADILRGQSAVYTLRFAEAGVFGPLRLDYDNTQPTFHAGQSDAFAYYGGNVIAFLIPIGEWSGALDYRLFTYYQDQASGNAAVDLAPNHTERPAPFAPESLPTIDIPNEAAP